MSTGPRLCVRVAHKTVEAEGVVGFELVAAEAGVLPPFEAGAHIDVDVPGVGPRPYSLCNAPSERHRYCLGVLRDPATRGGSAAMHDAVHAGSMLTISAPRNHFALNERARHSLLLAGGIGVTPLLSMAEWLHATGASFEMHYATRSPARTAFLPRLHSAPFAHRVHLHHDDGPDAQKLDLTRSLAAAQDGTHLYVCGPAGFIEAVRVAAGGAGWRDDHVHFESFSAAPVLSEQDRGFEIALHRSQRLIRVEAQQTIVDALHAHGVEVPVSCLQGVCGTCLTRVLDGEVDHKDMFLSPEEQAANDQMLVCCSRARSARLVLDL